jgi:hypothetical protein
MDDFEINEKKMNHKYVVEGKHINKIITPAEDYTLEEDIAILKASYNRHEEILFDEVMFLNRTNNLFIRKIGILTGIIILVITIMLGLIASLVVVEIFG